MSSADRPKPGERALLAAGTKSYDSREFPDLGKVPDSLRTIVGALKELGYTTVDKSPGYRLNPALASLRAAVRHVAAASPLVVAYYTGHGADLQSGTYYLVSKKSRPADLGDSALAARDLLELLTLRDDQGELLTNQPTVLVILDCCYSGTAGMKMLRDALDGIGNPNIWVIASAGPLEYAQQGLFATAFGNALGNTTTGTSQQYLSLDAIADAINQANAAAGQPGQQARWFPPPTGSAGAPPFFPNPGYAPNLAGQTVADQQHWLSRARAGPDETTTGSYLTGKEGRILAAEHLATWMTDPGPHGLAMVTGSPGTGKSALLSLPVLLTQQAWRQDLLRTARPGSLIQRTASLLPADTPLVAVHVRGLNTDQAARIVAQALGRDASSATTLLESLDTTPVQGQRVVVVDAADEAASPATLLGSLVVPLARHPGLRVVVGGRRHVLLGTDDADLTIDLDAGQYKDPQALSDYVRRLLVADEEPGVTTPYQATVVGEPDARTAAVAAAIARRATAQQGGPESFLVGRLLALSARGRREPVDVTSEGWQTGLPDTVADAFDEDLARLGHRQPLARTLLTALAWAKGPGLPWENIWAPVACAIAELDGELAHPPITDEDVRWLLAKAGAYIVEDLGPGDRSVYRPFHDLLGAHLRGEPSIEQHGADPSAAAAWEQARGRAEAAITRALLATIPTGPNARPDWLVAHPYLRTYLARHAAAETQALAELVQDMDFLAVADPIALTPLLSPTVPVLREAARIYRRAQPLLGGDARANAAYLHEASRALTGITDAFQGSEIRPLYLTHLASVRGDDSLLTITGHASLVTSVAFGATAEGQLLLASGSDDGTVRVWDPVTGAAVGGPLTGHASLVTSVAFGATPEGWLLLASGSDDGTVRVWDPVTGAAVGERFTGRVTSVAFGATPEGWLLLASGGYYGTVQVWDPVTGAAVGERFIGRVTSVAFGATAEGWLLLASGSKDGRVQVWDPVTGADVGKPVTGRVDSVRSVAFGATAEGRLLLASVGRDGAERVWDPVTGAAVGEPVTGGSGLVTSVAFGATERRLLLASGRRDGTVQIWDPRDRAAQIWDPDPRGNPRESLTGHTEEVTSVAFGTTAGGRLLLASGSKDRTVRVWALVTGATADAPPTTRHTEEVTSVAFGTTGGGRLLLASGSRRGGVQVWDPVSGAPVGEPLTGGFPGSVTSVAFGTTAAGRLLLAFGSRDWQLHVRDPVTRAAIGYRPSGRSDSVRSVAFGTTAEGRLLLASGTRRGGARVYEEVTGYDLGKPLTGHTKDVTSVMFGTTAAGRLLLASAGKDGTVRVWDPVTGAAVGQALTGHTGMVTSVAFATTQGGQLLLASASMDGTVRLWDPIASAAVGELLTGHTGMVTSVAFATTQGGQLLLASASVDKTVRWWDIGGEKCVLTLRRRSGVRSIAVSGPLLAVGDDEGVSVIELRF